MAGSMAPVIDGPWPFGGIRDAFRHFGTGEHRGKIVISMS